MLFAGTAHGAMECLLVVVCCRVTFIASNEKPLALRYQSSLLVVVEDYVHVLFWVVALDAARSLDSPAYRISGIGLMSRSVMGLAWSFFLEHDATVAESAVFVVFYLLLIVCVVYPLHAFNRASLRSSSDEGVINEFALEGEGRLTPGVNGRALQHALEQRCVHVARDYGLSAREGSCWSSWSRARHVQVAAAL